MMSLNYIHRKCTAGYKFSKSQEEINHMTYMHIKLLAKDEKEIETLILAVRTYNQDTGLEFDIEKYAMLVMESSKRHLTDRM